MRNGMESLERESWKVEAVTWRARWERQLKKESYEGRGGLRRLVGFSREAVEYEYCMYMYRKKVE